MGFLNKKKSSSLIVATPSTKSANVGGSDDVPCIAPSNIPSDETRNDEQPRRDPRVDKSSSGSHKNVRSSSTTSPRRQRAESDSLSHTGSTSGTATVGGGNNKENPSKMNLAFGRSSTDLRKKERESRHRLTGKVAADRVQVQGVKEEQNEKNEKKVQMSIPAKQSVVSAPVKKKVHLKARKSEKPSSPEKKNRRPRKEETFSEDSESVSSSNSDDSASDGEEEDDVEEDSTYSEYTESDRCDDDSTLEIETMDTEGDTDSNIDARLKDMNHQAYVIVNEYGSVEKLMLKEVCMHPRDFSPEKVVIKIECSTITLQDCMIRRGKWYDMQSLPFIPGSDIVGTVHELGADALRLGGLSVGDRVAAVVPSGGNAKYITVTYDKVIRVPEGVDPVIALCISSTYVPARQALDAARKLNTPFTGANILIIGGNGPSGLAAIELATLEGANVFATADESHHEYLTKRGVKCFPIDPKKWLSVLRGKMDVVIDSVCLDMHRSSSLALNPNGTLVCTGMSAVYTQGSVPAFGLKDVRDINAFYVKMKAKYFMNSVYYDKVERYEDAPQEYAQQFRYLCHLASKEIIKPVVSARASLNMVAFLHKAIEYGDTPYGVCVCTPWITRSDIGMGKFTHASN